MDAVEDPFYERGAVYNQHVNDPQSMTLYLDAVEDLEPVTKAFKMSYGRNSYNEDILFS